MKDRTIIVNGLSKTYTMIGWHLGYATVNAAIIKEIIRVQFNITSCPARFVQQAAITVLTSPHGPLRQKRERPAHGVHGSNM